MSEQQESRLFTREQKTGFVLLLIFALLAVGLGFLQLRNTIYGPFVIHLDNTTVASGPLDEATRLRQTDTDHDGLSDYDELYAYHTSSYLPDTDSDGIPDKDEIDRGTDPLCPEGKTCNREDVIVASSTTSISSPLLENGNSGFDLLGNIGTAIQNGADSAGAGSTGSGPALSPSFQALLADPVKLRAAIIATGKITKAELDKISDAVLMQEVNKLLQSQSAATTPH